MLGEEFGHLGLDRLGQQGARSVAQHLGKRVGERPWLKQLDDVSIGHGVSLLCWRSGGSNTPTIRRLLPVRPSPTSAHSSGRTSQCHLSNQIIVPQFGGNWRALRLNGMTAPGAFEPSGPGRMNAYPWPQCEPPGIRGGPDSAARSGWRLRNWEGCP